MKKYALLYSDKKEEDSIIFTSMFPNNYKINVGWNDAEINRSKKLIDQLIDEKVDLFIFGGFELGFKELVKYIKELGKEAKVICNTQDSLLYYEYERENFFELLKLNKEGIVDTIGFMRKGQYEFYNSLGYKCFYLKENFVLEKKQKYEKESNDKDIKIGVFPLNYTWDKNIFNQLCIAKMMDNCVLYYNALEERMNDFLTKMKIKNIPLKVKCNVESVAEAAQKVDIVVSTEFTDYVHPVFFVAMECGVPCLVSNTVDFLDETELKELVVSTTEDNPIINAQKSSKILENRDKIIKVYQKWKSKYNLESKKNVEEFIEF